MHYDGVEQARREERPTEIRHYEDSLPEIAWARCTAATWLLITLVNDIHILLNRYDYNFNCGDIFFFFDTV